MKTRLNMDMNHIEFLPGDAKMITLKSKDAYITAIYFVLPISEEEFFDTHANYNDGSEEWEVNFYKIDNEDQDPIIKVGKGMNFGTSGSGFDTLPFKVFTDNAGIYPCYLCELIFPSRVAAWADPTHETGIRMDYDYELLAITGKQDEDKIKALILLNKIFTHPSYKSVKKPSTVKYNDITTFLFRYFKKASNELILQRLLAISSPTAYRDSIEAFLKTKIIDVEKEIDSIKKPVIKTETELQDFVYTVITDFLKQRIEKRNWIEPFWNEKQRIIQKKESKTIAIKKIPKKEISIQPTLFIFLQLILNHFGIHIEKETDEGIGKLDFKCLYTTTDNECLSVSVEFKLAHNTGLKNGIKKQLPVYMDANKSKAGIFINMWFKDHKAKHFDKPAATKEETIGMINNLCKQVSHDKKIRILDVFIDASIKKTASK